jgi:hypothetical protein
MTIKIRSLNFNNKDIYSKKIMGLYRIPKHVERWEEDFPGLKEMDSEFWANIYKNSFQYCRETKLQSLQYRLINRIINCQQKLMQWKIINNSICKFCNLEDTLIHFFLQCSNTKNLWYMILNWWNSLDIIKIELFSHDLSECLLFGFPIKDPIFNLLNLICLNVKWYIYQQKALGKNERINLTSFLPRLKNKLNIEERIFEKYKKDKELDIIKIITEHLG